jgi:replicative DNA helicase
VDSLKMEIAVLHSCLRTPSVIPMVRDKLPVDAFQRAESRAFWKAILACWEDPTIEGAELPSLIRHMHALGLVPVFKNDQGIGLSYQRVINHEAVLENTEAVSQAVRLLHQGFMVRRLKAICSKAEQTVDAPGAEILSVIAALESELHDLKTGEITDRTRLLTIKDAVKSALAEYDRIQKGDHGMTGIPTGYGRIDRLISGWQPGQMYMIGGWFKAGKTSFALRTALEAALKENLGVVYGLWEMSPRSLATKYLAQWFGVRPSLLNSGSVSRIGSWDWDGFLRAVASPETVEQFQLNRLHNLVIADAINWSVPEFAGLVHYANAQRKRQGIPPVGLLVVDYLQLVRYEGRGYENRETEVNQLGMQVLALAKQLQVPVLALTQLNQERGGKTRESRALMGHCDAFWTVNQEVQKNPGGPVSEGMKKQAWLHMVYNRHADSNLTLPMLWDPQRQSFLETCNEVYQGPPPDSCEGEEAEPRGRFSGGKKPSNGHEETRFTPLPLEGLAD